MSTRAKELPHAVDYNGVDVYLRDVAAFEDKNDYSYSLYCVVAIDCHSLDDSQYHWLKESDMTVNAYLTSDKNGYDFQNGESLGNIYSDNFKTIFAIFSYEPSRTKENRYSFFGSEIHIALSLEQDDTYEYVDKDKDTHNLHKCNEVSYTYIVPEELTEIYGDTNGLEDYIKNYFVD